MKVQVRLVKATSQHNTLSGKRLG